MKTIVWRAVVVSLLSSASTTVFPFGEIDPSYSGETIPDWVCGTPGAPLPDDSVFVPVANTFHHVPPYTFGLARFLANGKLDRSWGVDGIAQVADPTSSLAIVVLPDHSVIIPGSQLQKLRADGTPEINYGVNGLSERVADVVLSVATSTDGSVYVLGRNGPLIELHHLLPDGRHDSTFGTNGVLSSLPEGIYAWSVKDDGTLEVGYGSTDASDHFAPGLHRYPVDFSTTERPTGRVMPRSGVASWSGPQVRIDGAGGAVFSLTSTSSDGIAQVYLERFLPDGSVDAGFGLSPISVRGQEGSGVSSPQGVQLIRSAAGSWMTLIEVTWPTFTFPYVPTIRPGFFLERFGVDGKPAAGVQQGVAIDIFPGTFFQLNTGKTLQASTNAQGCQLLRLLTDGEPRIDGILVEYYHPALRHYFLTLDTFEAAGLDAVPYGWQRTGRTFPAWQPVAAPATTAVCRFYGDPVIGPNSHFYTPEGPECDGLIALEQSTPPGVPVWHLEGKPFRVSLPSADGTCPGNLDPVFRVFNGPVDNANGSAHRYTTDPALYAQMQALGWLPEGVHFCVPLLGPR